MAYFECLHEVKLIVDLMYEEGIAGMRYSISTTAEYGDLTRGPRIVTDETKAEMRTILDEIQSGQFADEWIAESEAGGPNFQRLRDAGKQHPIEEVGARLRSMMPWISAAGRRSPTPPAGDSRRVQLQPEIRGCARRDDDERDPVIRRLGVPALEAHAIADHLGLERGVWQRCSRTSWCSRRRPPAMLHAL